MNSTNDIAVLLITFNRADNTTQVFNQIRKAKVSKLYIANDAPRKGNKLDEENRQKIKGLLNKIDWDCQVHTLFHEKNCGNGFGPVAAINWVFEHEEKAIILEDDCVPSLPFFDFCKHCLNKYEADTRIWLISGRSHHPNHPFFKEYDYVFSKFAHTWGWATWKRCWENFDMQMNSWNKFQELGGFDNTVFFPEEAKILNTHFSEFVEKPINSWDARWAYCIHANSGLGIVPSVNLIENIGYVGAHTNGIQKLHKIQADNNYTFKREPPFITTNKSYEKQHFEKHIRHIFGKPSLFLRLKRRIIRLVKNS